MFRLQYSTVWTVVLVLSSLILYTMSQDLPHEAEGASLVHQSLADTHQDVKSISDRIFELNRQHVAELGVIAQYMQNSNREEHLSSSLDKIATAIDDLASRINMHALGPFQGEEPISTTTESTTTTTRDPCPVPEPCPSPTPKPCPSALPCPVAEPCPTIHHFQWLSPTPPTPCPEHQPQVPCPLPVECPTIPPTPVPDIVPIKEYCEPPFFSVINQCLFLSTTERTWWTARLKCQAMGADLVTLEAPNALPLLVDYMKSKALLPGRSFWVGGSKKISGSQHHWVSGSVVRYGWQHGQPNDEGESCVVIGVPGSLLFDVNCARKEGYICSQTKS